MDEADRVPSEDLAACRRIGRLGAALLPPDSTVLTHCNAGALATAGYGTALGVIRGAVEAGKTVRVLADETRPFLQGARLTAWELARDGIPVEVITDGMGGHFLATGAVQAVVVGADRIAANGDTANKIGTYPLAVLAKENGVPFYVAAPTTTIDLGCPDGRAIPIEERDASEVVQFAGKPVAPAGVTGRYVAFDVTPARFITAIVTEAGVCRPPFTEACAGRSISQTGVDPAMASRVILVGIETSCDETSAAILGDDGAIRSNVVASQMRAHGPYGGVVPELAARAHLTNLPAVFEEALSRAGVGLEEVGLVAATAGPGLIGPLLVGLSAAKALAFARGIPIVGVNHLEGHLYSPYLCASGGPAAQVEYPFHGLVVSGGHAELVRVEADRIVPIARTRDDAPGEAFDKVARRAGLPYPGGPPIDRIASRGDGARYPLPIGRPGTARSTSPSRA